MTNSVVGFSLRYSQCFSSAAMQRGLDMASGRRAMEIGLSVFQRTLVL